MSPTRIELTGAAATGTIQIDTQPGCAWTAAVEVTWIQLTGNTSGAGSGSVSYAVAAVPPAEAPLRQSAIMIRWDTPTLGQNALVTQTTGPCDASFSPAPGPTSALTFGGAGGGGSAWVLAEPPFSGPWRIVNPPDWIMPWAWRAFQWGWFGDVPLGILR